MNEVVTYIADKAAEYLVEPIIQQGQCLFCPDMITQNLVEEKERLSKKRKRIQERIEEAKKKTKLIEKSVVEWMKEAENLLEAAESLKQEMEAKTNSFQGWCPPWRRYGMSKQMVKKTEEMRKQINIEFKLPFSRLSSLSNIDYDCSESFTFFQSTTVAYKEILEALQDGETKIIGLYGIGGSGKTALVNEVRKEAMKLQLFDKFIWVTVSRTPNIKTIQEQMGKMLDLKLTEENEEERAKRLWLSLKEYNRVLIIVDDAWEKFNLKHIGVAFDENHEVRCKVLLTTRNQEVCTLMECQKKIMLDLLSEEESWSLFGKCAGIDDQSSPMVLDLAHEVSKRCKGLLIAIKVMGSSLKGKQREFQVDQLKVALKTPKGSKPKKGGGEGAIFDCLRFSYDYLRLEEAKHLLCMCAMFPKDHVIPIEDLIRYGIGLGLGGESESFDFARSQIRMGLSELLDCCLLMYADRSKEYVMMHDLVHEMVLSISQEKKRTIMVSHEKDLKSLARDKVLKQCFAISSWDNETDRLPCQLAAPKLEILIVNTGSSLDLSSMSCEFKRLKVIAIINNNILSKISVSLPQSIESMTNLKTLRLKNWQLDDISFVLSLERLEILDLQYCIFNEVPDEIEKLHNLKLLDLMYTTVKNYNSKAIGRCSQLEEFYVSASRSDCPPPSQYFVHDVAAISLQRYELVLGETLEEMKIMEEMGSIMRVLSLQGFDVSTIDGSRRNLLQNAEYVHFMGLYGGFKKIVLMGCNLDNLKILNIDRCAIISFFPMSIARSMQQLEEMTIQWCPELRHVIKSDAEDGSNTWEEISLAPNNNRSLFPSLKKLSIRACPNLQVIFQISLAPNNTHSLFPSLKKLGISECPRLQFIFQISCVQQNELQIILPDLQVFELYDLENLLGIFPQNYASRWPSVRTLSWEKCPKLTTPWIGLELKQQDSMTSELQNLTLMDLPKLNLFWFGPSATQIVSFQYLKRLRIRGFKEMKVLFSMAVLRSLSGLTSLCIHNCDELVKIIEENEESKNSALVEVFFPKLSYLEIQQCNKLKSLFSIAMITPQLDVLNVKGAAQLKEIFGQNSEGDIFNDMEIMVPKWRVIYLEKLPSFVWINECSKFTLALGANQAIPLRHRTEEKLIVWYIALSMNQLCGQQMCPVALKAFLSIERFNLWNSGVEGIFQLQLVEEGHGGLQQSNNVTQKHLNSNLMELLLCGLTELRFIWSGPAQFLGFHKLKEIRMERCPKLKTIFPAGIVGSLQNLKCLTIFSCEGLEEISELQVECFPNLCNVIVVGCNKLKCIFYADCMASHHYARIKRLTIRECSQLERIYGLKRTIEADNENHGEEKLLKLYQLELRSLPNFTEIGHGINLKKKPCTHYRVEECPNYIQQQFPDLEEDDDDGDDDYWGRAFVCEFPLFSD